MQAALAPIVAPSDHCYTKEALWSDDCIKECYLFWHGCTEHNKWHDPVCLEPMKKLAKAFNIQKDGKIETKSKEIT